MRQVLKVLLSVLFIQAVLSFSLQKATDSKLHLVKVTDSDALCLDGSQAAYYISKGGDPKKFFIEFEGGGWCSGANSITQTLDDCLQRSKNDQGSSKGYPDTIEINDGVLSNNEQNNFKDWTRVFFRYCTGSGHQGTKKNPVSYKGTNLYFRGHNVTVGLLNSLERQNKLFSEATHVVVGGDSAGGLAVFLWTNYIKDMVKVGKVWALPDSGIFLDSTNVASGKNDYKNMFKNLMSITNVEIAPPVPECVQKFKNEMENCMFAANLAPHIKAPMFIIQSLYDTWSIPNIVGVRCIQGGSLLSCTSDQKTVIEEYHRNTTNAIFEMTVQNRNINGFFAPVCANHVYSRGSAYYSPQFRIPLNSQNSIAKGVQNWMDSNSDPTTYRLIDTGSWPDNLSCAGKVSSGNYFNFLNEPVRKN